MGGPGSGPRGKGSPSFNKQHLARMFRSGAKKDIEQLPRAERGAAHAAVKKYIGKHFGK